MTKRIERLRIGGMDCAGCATKIEAAVNKLPGVTSAEVSVGAGTMTVLGHADLDLARVKSTVGQLGYVIGDVVPPGPAHDSHAPHEPSNADEANSRHQDHDHGQPLPEGMRWWQTAKGQLVIASGLAVVVALVGSSVFPSVKVPLYAAAMLIGLVPVARRAYAAARAGVYFTIEMLMTIAAAGALVIGATEEAAVVVFLFAVGELLEGIAAQSARSSIRALGNLLPSEVVIERADGSLSTIATKNVEVGMTILVRPGDRVPADGRIIEGVSDIDEAPVTGESVLRSKSIGADVFAGSVNRTGTLKVQATRAASDNTIARIIRSVEQAQEAKAPFERFIDRFARWYMPSIVTMALLVAILPPLAIGGDWHTWAYRALTLLLIGCPCALVIATPAAIAASLANAARRGILLKGGTAIEAASKLMTVAFDKTGTLTTGQQSVTDLIGIGRSDTEILAAIAGLERGSNHSIAGAILRYADQKGISPAVVSDIRVIPGEGVSGRFEGEELFLVGIRHAARRVIIPDNVAARVTALQSDGKTVSLAVLGSRTVGLVALRDEPRAGVADAMADLKSLGLSTVMLTGDNVHTAQAVAARIGIEAKADLMPDDKLTYIRQQAATGGIAMVGDGINDAPALAAATLGIAMAGGTGVALETADAALVGDRISGVADLIRLARATMANIHQNVAVALGSKVIFLVTTVLGMTGLWVAVIADTGATVLVTVNALRLLRLPSGASHASGGRVQ